jgi:hypothetical protein
MIKVIKFHVGLIKFLKQQLPKQKSLRKGIVFLYGLIKNAYLPQLLRLYKDLFLMFDPIFIAKRKREEKYTQARKDLHNAWKLVQYMINREDTRTKRKQVRRDFEKHGMISKELEQEILKELYGIKKVGE